MVSRQPTHRLGTFQRTWRQQALRHLYRAASGVWLWFWCSYEIRVTYSIVENDVKFYFPRHSTACTKRCIVDSLAYLFVRCRSCWTINGWVWRNLCDAPSMKVLCRCRVYMWLIFSLSPRDHVCWCEQTALVLTYRIFYRFPFIFCQERTNTHRHAAV